MYDRLLFRIAFLSALTICASGSAMADGAPLPLPIPMLPPPGVVAPEPDATIVPNEVVLARGPYHSMNETAKCTSGGAICQLNFAKVAPKRRVEISNISCLLEASGGAQAIAVYETSAAKNEVFGTLPLQLQIATSSVVIWSANETVFTPVTAGEHLTIFTQQSAPGFELACGITGQILTLK